MLRDAIGVELHCLTRAEGAPGPLLVTNGGDVFESPEGFRGAVGNWGPWPFKISVESAAKGIRQSDQRRGVAAESQSSQRLVLSQDV